MAYQDPEELFNAAKEYFNEGHYKIVESMIQQLLLLDDNNPDVFYMAGTLAFEKGKLKKAIHFFKKSLAIDPHFTDASIGLSIIFNDLGKYEEGKKTFEEAYALMKLKGANSKPYLDESIAKKHEELGDIYFLSKNFEDALENFNRARKISKNEIFYGIKAIDCLLQMKLHGRAERETRTLIEKYPEDPRVISKFAKILYQTDKIQESTDYWQKLLSIDPNNQEAQMAILNAKQNRSMELNL